MVATTGRVSANALGGVSGIGNTANKATAEFRARIRTGPAGSGELEASRTAGRDRHGGLHGGKNQSGGRHHHVAAGATNPRKRG